MKATGIVRRLDDLGRIVIPLEIRKQLHLREGHPIEFYLEDHHIVLKPYDEIEDTHTWETLWKACGRYMDSYAIYNSRVRKYVFPMSFVSSKYPEYVESYMYGYPYFEFSKEGHSFRTFTLRNNLGEPIAHVLTDDTLSEGSISEFKAVCKIFEDLLSESVKE